LHEHDSLSGDDHGSVPPSVAWPDATPESHKLIPHVRARANATVSLLPDGRVLIVEPLCTTPLPEPSVLWFCMQSSGRCYLSSCPFAPYTVPAPPIPFGYPNPNRPHPSFANVTRHWQSNPTYYVHFPQGSNSANADIFAGSLTNPYTYREFLWDVAYSMARYSTAAPFATHLSLPVAGFMGGHPCAPTPPATIGDPTVNVTAVFGGLSGQPGAPGTTVTTRAYTFPPTPNGLIWHTANKGPTGDGINEVVFLPFPVGPLPQGGLGFTSMLMDPVSGRIDECDVLYSTQPVGQWPGRGDLPGCPSVSPCYAGGPGWTTVIPHELGHFFGLDHTNLHPGHMPAGANACTPASPPGNANPVNGAPPSLVGFPSTPFPQAFDYYPDMVGGSTWVAGWRCDPNRPLHHDDASGLAELYPVPVPGNQAATPQILPAINQFGRIEGTVSYNPSPQYTVYLFGMNVLPVRTALSPPLPLTGRLSGTGRLTPGIGVVGAVDTATGLRSTGEFRIERVDTAFVGAGKPYDIIVESPDSLGLDTVAASTAFTWTEWFYDPNFNPTINAMNVAFLQQHLRGSAPFGQWTGGPFGNPGNPSLGSLFVAPGSVIQVNINLSNGASFVEPVSRPGVMMSPRNGKQLPFNPANLITATVVHDYELDFTSGLWTVVGGLSVPAGVPPGPNVTTNQPNPVVGLGPWTTTWTISYGALGITAGSPATVRFTASEYPSNGSPARPPAGITAVVGINENKF
jgi:hypothetical protein